MKRVVNMQEIEKKHIFDVNKNLRIITFKKLALTRKQLLIFPENLFDNTCLYVQLQSKLRSLALKK